ncbi:helix-turn-helix domain-containing protein [Nocardia sp. NPDC127526]|uniref:helix-turn-helix domain-containing protein n=1 Tax=Nocardia sp. NPDC127526 TaxID=3345393 RepID=UPI00363046E2
MPRTSLPQFVRSRREALKFTQARLAELSGISKSAVEKIESGKLIPGLESLGSLFDALLIPYVYRERVVAALFPGMLDRILGPGVGTPTAADLADLEDLPYPAAYISLPEGHIFGTNQHWDNTFPGLQAKANMVEWVFTDPIAKGVLLDWDRVAHGFTYGLRMMGPLVLSADRIAEIAASCESNPNWQRMWTTDPIEPANLQPILRLASPFDWRISQREIKIDKPHLPHRPWVTYRLTPVREQAAA